MYAFSPLQYAEWNALFFAVKNQDMETVKYLLDNGSDAKDIKDKVLF